MTYIHVRALLLISCVTLGKLLNLPEPQFPHFKNVPENSTYFIIITL